MTTKPLIIVESPSKARTIERYLGKKFHLLASNGHIKDLPRKDLGINISKDFKPKYVTLPGKYNIIKTLKQNAKGAPQILIATDPDREGEAIAWHIATELSKATGKIKRAIFTEITPAGIRNGIENLRNIDRKLVDAQQARRVIDRIVGFQVSEFLWSVLYSGLSAGRVQSVALRLVCERHDEITHFVPEEYWSLEVELKTKSEEVFSARLHKIEGKKPEISDESSVNKIMGSLKNAEYVVTSITRKDVKKNPYPPLITSTLQQDAAIRLRFSPSRTMRIAQSLYEGVDIGKGESTGLITYMRTDSTRLAQDAVTKVRKFISGTFGKEYLPQRDKVYKQKKKLVQDAHEAIRPTHPELTPEDLKGKIKEDERKLYRLIWQRFVACQMNPSILAQTTIAISAGDKYLFRTVGSTVKFDGFRKVYPSHKTEKESIFIPKLLEKGEKVQFVKFNPEQHFTKPPPYFTESSLIKELDSRGIGRPSTFAETISKLYKREYIENKKRKLIPTERGITVNGILVSNLPKIFDFGFTAKMEEELDDIEEGNKGYFDVVNHFYQPFHSSMTEVRERRIEIKSSLVEETDEMCEKCGKPMVIKWNRQGEKFLACSGFPKCRNAKSLTQKDDEKKPEILDKLCPECGGELHIKTGRFGRYVGCSNYPDCKHTEPITTGVSCPKSGCNGKIIERTSKKKRKVFYGCSNYPKCDFVTWRTPILFKCKKCDNTYVEEHVTKKRGTYYQCPECKTSYKSINTSE